MSKLKLLDGMLKNLGRKIRFNTDKNMQIIVPMSGFGERFRSAGYKLPKPLIIVDNKTIIEHIVDMFPGETNFTFICNSHHLEQDDFRMREILESACPSGKIIGIAGHKLGPIDTICQVADIIEAGRPANATCQSKQPIGWEKRYLVFFV
jgi:hypothetical protein